MARKLKFNVGDEVVYSAGGRVFKVLGYDSASKTYKIQHQNDEPYDEPVNRLQKFIPPKTTAQDVVAALSNNGRIYNMWLQRQDGSTVREGDEECFGINYILEDKVGLGREYAVSIIVAKVK